MSNDESSQRLASTRRLHRLAQLAVALVWPLIWVGGLVTTYDAGMAVPDWPATYGYNLFLYPIDTWWAGPWDLFIEHGHRLLGALVGMVAIAMAVVAWPERRRWVFWLSIGLVLAVTLQGVLGGQRVVQGDRTLAMIHGCGAQVVFCLFVLSAVVSSGPWLDIERAARARADSETSGNVAVAGGRPIGRLAVLSAAAMLLVGFCQLLLGAQIRHVQPIAGPSRFAMIVGIHVTTALVLWLISAGVWLRLRRCGDLTLSRPAVVLIGLVTLQISLGVGTWVVSYGWPSFLHWIPGSTGFLIRSKGFVDSIIVTAHVATGALILAISTLLFARCLRSWWCRQQDATTEPERAAGKTAQASASTFPATT